jgi:calcium-dependent protein kinase
MESAKLGEGAFGSVYRARQKATGALRAIKEVAKGTRHELRKTKKEIDIMRRIDHPSIIKLFETFEDDHSIYMAMELCVGGDLFERTRARAPSAFTEAESAVIMRQVFRCVHYLHGVGICHRDVKLENFLFTSKGDVSKAPIKMIDFGLACLCQEGEIMTQKVGTPMYVAPEVLDSRYTRSCDLWSCGVVLYVLLSGTVPFKGKDKEATIAKVRSARYDFQGPRFRGVSQGAKNLISRLLCWTGTRSTNRVTAEQALTDPWLLTAAPAEVTWLPSPGLADSLSAFGCRNKLAQAALLVSARQLGEGAELEMNASTFAALDANKDGQVSVEELKQGLRLSGLQVANESDVQAMVEAVDENGNGMIDYTEFLAATLDSRFYLQEDVLRRSFSVFDLDGDGVISKQELLQVLKVGSWCANLNAEIGEILSEVDSNGDGSIDFDEYKAMLKGMGPPIKRDLRR